MRKMLPIVLASAAWAQAPAPSQPEVSSHDAPITFSSRVNLISVPVVVRDRNGRAMGNLQKDDFQLFDKGKAQTITKFSLEKSGRAVELPAAPPSVPRENAPTAIATPPALPERYVAYLVDDVHLDRGDLLNTRVAMHRHLDDSAEATARAAIFTTSGVALTDFTADREKLHAAVNRIQPYTSGIDLQQDCPAVSYYLADSWVNQYGYMGAADKQLLGMLTSGVVDAALVAAFKEAMMCGPCPPGTDQLTGFPMCSVIALTVLKAATRKAMTHGTRETSLGLGALRDVVRKLSSAPGNRNLVLVSPGFLLSVEHRAEERDLLERAIRANVVVNTIDTRGLFTVIPGGPASDRYNPLEQFDRQATHANDILAELANGTGGTFFHNDNDLKGGLNVIAARPEYVYILGFSPRELKYDGAYHGLKVTLNSSANLTIQARLGYWAPRHPVDSAEMAMEEIADTVFSRDEVHGIPLEVQTEFFESGDAKYDLTVTAQVDAKALRFDKAGDRNDDTLTVVTGLFDPNGNYVAGLQKVVELHLRDRTLEAFQQGGINVKEDFTINPGRYLVRVVVRDSGGETITARNGGIQIP